MDFTGATSPPLVGSYVWYFITGDFGPALMKLKKPVAFNSNPRKFPRSPPGKMMFRIPLGSLIWMGYVQNSSLPSNKFLSVFWNTDWLCVAPQTKNQATRILANKYGILEKNQQENRKIIIVQNLPFSSGIPVPSLLGVYISFQFWILNHFLL